MTSRIASVLLHVSNLRNSTAFYTDQLGFEETLSSRSYRSRQPTSLPDFQVEIDIGGGVELHLLEAPALVVHAALNFRVQNLDNFTSALRSRGVKHDYHPTPPTIYCKDPDGHILTFAEYR